MATIKSRTRNLACMATLLAGALPASAFALEPTCERYLAAAEKSAAQPAVHTVTETGGTRIESIAVGGKAWSRMDGGAWTPLPANVRALGRQMVADMRAGRLRLSACKVTGTETVAGTPTTVISYALDVGTGP